MFSNKFRLLKALKHKDKSTHYTCTTDSRGTGGIIDTTSEVSELESPRHNQSGVENRENLFEENYNRECSVIQCKTQKKRVEFSKIVRVCLMPCRKEVEEFSYRLWWNAKELDEFKIAALIELNITIQVQRCTVKQAMVMLYQCEEYRERSSISQ
jgi:hypothetical protein